MKDAPDLLQSCTQIPGATYRPSWRAGTLASDVMAGTPILAGAAQLTVSTMAPGGTQLLTAGGRRMGVRHSRIHMGAPTIQGSLGINEMQSQTLPGGGVRVRV